MHANLDRLAIGGLDALDLVFPHHLAHGALGNGFDRRILRIWNVEQKRGRVLDLPIDREIDVDDVFVAGQHQAFLDDIGKLRRFFPRFRRLVSDRDLVLVLDFRRVGDLDRPGQVITHARIRNRAHRPEAQHHTDFVRPHEIDTTRDP